MHGLDTFHASPPFLGFNDTAHFKEQQEITFYNHDKHNSLTLHLYHQPSLAVTGYSTKHTNYTPCEPVGLYKYNNPVALVQFSQKYIVIPPGQSTKVTVHIQPPTDTFSNTSHAIYGGYIKATTNQTDISIPYMGMIGNMKDLPILDRINTSSNSIGFPFPSIGSPFNNHVLGSKETGHFTIKHSQNQTVGGPYVLVRLLTGTRLLQIQILNKKNKVIGDMPLDNLDMPRAWLMRNTLEPTQYSYSFYSWQWNGDYVPRDVTKSGSNGHHKPKLVKKGIYRLKIRALKVFGNMNKAEDWDEWISPKLMLQNK